MDGLDHWLPGLHLGHGVDPWGVRAQPSEVQSQGDWGGGRGRILFKYVDGGSGVGRGPFWCQVAARLRAVFWASDEAGAQQLLFGTHPYASGEIAVASEIIRPPSVALWL